MRRYRLKPVWCVLTLHTIFCFLVARHAPYIIDDTFLDKPAPDFILRRVRGRDAGITDSTPTTHASLHFPSSSSTAETSGFSQGWGWNFLEGLLGSGVQWIRAGNGGVKPTTTMGINCLPVSGPVFHTGTACVDYLFPALSDDGRKDRNGGLGFEEAARNRVRRRMRPKYRHKFSDGFIVSSDADSHLGAGLGEQTNGHGDGLSHLGDLSGDGDERVHVGGGNFLETVWGATYRIYSDKSDAEDNGMDSVISVGIHSGIREQDDAYPKRPHKGNRPLKMLFVDNVRKTRPPMEYLMLPSYLVSDPRRRQPASYFEILKRRRDEGNSGAEDTEHHNEQGQSNEKSDGFGRSFSSWRSFPSAPPSSSSSCEITLTTHVSLETLHYVDSIAQTWAGPISVAVYVDEPAQLDGIEKTLWDASTRWETEGISRVTMHLLLGPRFNDPGDDPQNFESSHYDPFARLRDIGMGQGRHPYDFAYPVNALRNLAMEQSNTELVFNMDPEFQPSESMHERLCRQQTQKSFRSHFKRRGAMFIVPEFEYASDAVMELVKKTKPGEEDQSVTILKRTETEEHSVSREDGPDLRTATGQVDGPPVAPVLDRHKSINTTHLLQLCAELKVLPHKAIPSLRILEEPSLPPPSSPLTQSNNANETATPGPPQIPQKVIDNWCSGLSRTLEGFTLAKENTLINYQRWLRATYKSTRSEAALKSPNPSSSSSDLKSAEVNIGPFPYRLTYNGGHSLSVYEVRMLEPCCWVGHRHQMPQFDEVFRGGTYARRQPVLDAAVAGFDFSVLTDVFVMYRGGGTGNGGSGDTPLRSQTGVGSSASAAGVPASFTVESHLDHPRLRWEMIKDVLDATFAHFHNNIKARATSKKMQFRKMYRQLFWAEGFM